MRFARSGAGRRIRLLSVQLLTCLPPHTPTHHTRAPHILLTACSQPLYSTAAPGHPPRSAFLDELVSASCPFAATLFYCLLNTVRSKRATR